MPLSTSSVAASGLEEQKPTELCQLDAEAAAEGEAASPQMAEASQQGFDEQSERKEGCADESKQDSAQSTQQQAQTEQAASEPKDLAKPADQQESEERLQKEGADEEEHPEAEQSKPQRKMSLRARVLAELGSADPLEAMARISAKLPEHDALIAAAQKVESEKQEAVEAAEREVAELSKVVKDAEKLEFEALEHVKAVQKRKRECAKAITQRQKELQDQQDVLLLLEMEVARRKQVTESMASMESEQDAKRQKIDELQRVVEESKKAQEELRQREREARESMRQLAKEQKQISRLGAFGRRQRASTKTKTAGAADTANANGSTGSTPGADAPVVDLLPVKREVLQAFGSRRAPVTEEEEVISIEDSQ